MNIQRTLSLCESSSLEKGKIVSSQIEESSPFQAALSEDLSMSERWFNTCVNMNWRGHSHNWVILKRNAWITAMTRLIFITCHNNHYYKGKERQCLQQLFNQTTYKNFLQWLTDLTRAVIRTQTAGLFKFNSLSKHPSFLNAGWKHFSIQIQYFQHSLPNNTGSRSLISWGRGKRFLFGLVHPSTSRMQDVVAAGR